MITYPAIFALLASAPSVTALCPGGIHPIQLPENPTLPAMTYQDVGGGTDPTYETEGPRTLRLQIDFYAKNAMAADALRAAAVEFMAGVKRQHLSDGSFVQYVDFLQPIGGFNNDARQFRLAAEFEFFYT